MLEVQVWIKFNIQDSFDYVQFILRKLWIFNQFNENKFGTNLSQMCTYLFRTHLNDRLLY